MLRPCTSQVTSDTMSGNRSVIQRVMSLRCCIDPQSHLAADCMLPVHKMSSLELSGMTSNLDDRNSGYSICLYTHCPGFVVSIF
ncbi:hypothetical protein EK904_009550 [Melospiza melodia maxima]|nr:hypothetical protein EK904_009550 [Melospiza melodia maxima]